MENIKINLLVASLNFVTLIFIISQTELVLLTSPSATPEHVLARRHLTLVLSGVFAWKGMVFIFHITSFIISFSYPLHFTQQETQSYDALWIKT